MTSGAKRDRVKFPVRIQSPEREKSAMEKSKPDQTKSPDQAKSSKRHKILEQQKTPLLLLATPEFNTNPERAKERMITPAKGRSKGRRRTQGTPNSDPRRSSQKKLREPTFELILTSKLEEGEPIKPYTNIGTDEEKTPRQPQSLTSTSKCKRLYQSLDSEKRGTGHEI